MLVDKIRDMEIYCRFNTKSPFTNVLLEEIIEICLDTLNKISNPTKNRISFQKLMNRINCAWGFRF